MTGLGLIAGNAAAVWAFLIIVLDTVIIYQLTVNWSAEDAAR